MTKILGSKQNYWSLKIKYYIPITNQWNAKIMLRGTDKEKSFPLFYQINYSICIPSPTFDKTSQVINTFISIDCVSLGIESSTMPTLTAE